MHIDGVGGRVLSSGDGVDVGVLCRARCEQGTDLFEGIGTKSECR